MFKVLRKVIVIVSLSSLLVNLNFTSLASAEPTHSAISEDASVPEHGRALGIALSDPSVKATFKVFADEGRRPVVGKPSFVHATPPKQSNPGNTDWYLVTFKADKDDKHQAFVTAFVDVTNRSVGAATIWYADEVDEQQQLATLRMVEFRDGKVTRDRKMMLDGVNRKAFDEQGRELKSNDQPNQQIGLSSLWGTPAAAETISVCDLVSTLEWITVCWLVGSVVTGYLGTLIAAVVCGLVGFIATWWVCTQIEINTPQYP